MASPHALAAAEPARDAAFAGDRPRVHGRFLYAGAEKLYVRGVTYGTFGPNSRGELLPEPAIVGADFADMSANGINAVRTYTAPPVWLLDLAQRHELRVLAGLSWESHVAFLEDRTLVRDIVRRTTDAVRALAGHPALLAYGLANEIPAPIVRWLGRRRVERFLGRLSAQIKEVDPGGLVTYVNYPTTEFLRLDFLDFHSFNVYLEQRDRLEAYLARLHNLCGERPLVMAEIGLDSRRNGRDAQAESLAWQVRTSFESGCAGTFVFSWTDEWNRGGLDVPDWDFGLTTRSRQPKPALAAVRSSYAEVPVAPIAAWPRISVVVCSYNGEATIRDTLDALAKLDYPNYEIVVIDDGSTDATAEIARRYEVSLLSTPNQGLAAARNLGLQQATGEIVAYIDDDAYPDAQWLTYLAQAFLRSDHVGVGGPNLLPAEDGPIAACVANSPGGPTHVLLTDRIAEHIPGCNMAFRREALEEIGGFDARFRTAGDDVDVCWSLQRAGGTLGFHPSAVVWHHRRDSVSRYLKQQIGYGRAEALLERKWPEKFNTIGHVPWGGRIYGRGLTLSLHNLIRPGRVYHGTWGSAPFQAVYPPAPSALSSLPLMPEWYLLVLCLALLTAMGLAWPPLLWAAPLLAISALTPVAQAVWSAVRAPEHGRYRRRNVHLVALTAALHLLQPASRLLGRIRHGLTPWRLRHLSAWQLPRPTILTRWSGLWREPTEWIHMLETAVAGSGMRVVRGGHYARWDLDVRGAFFGGARALLTFEDHELGQQLVRVRMWPRSARGLTCALLATGLAAAAFADGAFWIAGLLGLGALAIVAIAICDCGVAMGKLHRAMGTFGERND